VQSSWDRLISLFAPLAVEGGVFDKQTGSHSY
jgi:hypothetical protein